MGKCTRGCAYKNIILRISCEMDMPAGKCIRGVAYNNTADCSEKVVSITVDHTLNV